MKYFFISNSAEESVIGKKYPQCKGMPSGMGLTYKWFEQENSMTRLNNNEFPDFEPELLFELEQKAILTDVVSPSNLSAKGFLVNQKVKDILSHFNLMEHRYYPATVIAKGKEIPYYWLHFKKSNDYFFNHIDYSNTDFTANNLGFKKIADLNVNSYEEYLTEWEKPSVDYISASKLKFDNELESKELDLFYIAHMFLDPFVSERVIEVFEAYKVTGFDLKPQSVL